MMYANEMMICNEYNRTLEDNCYSDWEGFTGNGKGVMVTCDDGREILVKPKTRIDADVWINNEKLNTEKESMFVVGFRDVLSITHYGEDGNSTYKITIPWKDIAGIQLVQ